MPAAIRRRNECRAASNDSVLASRSEPSRAVKTIHPFMAEYRRADRARGAVLARLERRQSGGAAIASSHCRLRMPPLALSAFVVIPQCLGDHIAQRALGILFLSFRQQ